MGLLDGPSTIAFAGNVSIAASDFVQDHFRPGCMGGKTDPCNLVVACLDCNNLKNGQDSLQWCATQGIDIEFVLCMLVPLTKEERRIGHKLFKMYCPDGRLERQAKKARDYRARIKAELANVPF